MATDVPVTPTPTSIYPDPIPGIIPFGTVTVVAGAPGVGKTAMLADWIRRWRAEEPINGHPTNPAPGGYHYFAADRQWASHHKWFTAVGFPDIPHYSLANDQKFNLALLRQAELSWSNFMTGFNYLNPPRGAHLFVDPIAPLFIPGDINKPRDVAAALLQLSRLCTERAINITVAAHFGKQKGDDSKDTYTRPQDRIAGSFAFSGYSDTQVYLLDPQPPGRPYTTVGWVPRHAPPEEFSFVRRKEDGLFEPFELFTELDKQQKAYDTIPAEGDHHTHDILRIFMEVLKVASAQAERFLASLVRDGRLIKVRRGVYRKAKVS